MTVLHRSLVNFIPLSSLIYMKDAKSSCATQSWDCTNTVFPTVWCYDTILMSNECSIFCFLQQFVFCTSLQRGEAFQVYLKVDKPLFSEMVKPYKPSLWLMYLTVILLWKGAEGPGGLRTPDSKVTRQCALTIWPRGRPLGQVARAHDHFECSGRTINCHTMLKLTNIMEAKQSTLILIQPGNRER